MKKKLNSTLLVLGLLMFAGNGLSQLSTFPYYQDFETFSTCTGSCNLTCLLINGWVNEGPGDAGEWIVDVGGTSSSNTGPSVDYDPGNTSGKYLYFETSSPCYSNVTAILHAPVLDMTSVGGLNMIFSNHMYGSSMGTLSVEVSTDGGITYPTMLWTKSGNQGDQWFVDTVNLIAYAGMSDVRVRFRGVSSTSFTSDMAIDAVTFYEPLPLDAGITAIPAPGLPSCNLVNSPVSGTVRNFGTNTLTSVNINWSVNAIIQTPFAWTGSLVSGMEATASLGTYTFINGDFLQVWTSDPNAGVEMGSGPANDTTSITIQTGLMGPYSIGIAGDYANFNDAVAALSLYGVCGPVVIDVDDGIYPEQISIPEIMGASVTNTITFQSLNADPTLVTMIYSPTNSASNYTLQMDGADYVTFKEMTLESNGPTFSTVIDVTNESSWNTFDGNMIIGDSNTFTTSTNKAVITSFNGTLDTMNMFLNNAITYGSYGIFWYGNNTTGLEKGLIFDNNVLSHIYYRGIHLYYMEDVTVTNNIVRFSGNYSGSTYCAYSSYNNGNLTFNGNDFNVPSRGYNWYLSNCTSYAASSSYMSNNFFSISDSLNTGTSYGIYMTNTSNLNVINNSINMYSGGINSRALYMTSGLGNKVYNNNIVNWGPGYGFYLNGGLSSSDYNNIYAPNGNVGYFGVAQNTLLDWQIITGTDMNSVSGNPGYTTDIDLHTCNDTLLDGNGWEDMNITMDFDGQLRDTLAFDIGADEFLGLTNFGFTMDTIWKCSNAAELLGGWSPSSDGAYLWSTTETSPTINASAPGTYDVTVTTACGTAISSLELVDIPDAVAGFNILTSFMTGIFTSTSSGTIDTYSWDFGDGSGTSTNENPIYVYGSEGTYVVTLTVTGPCGTSTYTGTTVASVLGIDENALSQSLELYPNPNTGEFTVSLNLETSSNISAIILDAQGRVIWNEDLGFVNGTISKLVNLGSDASGVYFLRVNTDIETAVRRIIVE